MAPGLGAAVSRERLGQAASQEGTVPGGERLMFVLHVLYLPLVQRITTLSLADAPHPSFLGTRATILEWLRGKLALRCWVPPGQRDQVHLIFL